jgi:hypothetical protein
VPASYRIDQEHGLIFSTATGVLTDEDLFSHQRRLRSDPAFDGNFNQLWDLREVSDVKVSSSTVRELAEARSYEPGARGALLAPRNVTYGLARMFQMLHDKAPEQTRVFRTLKEAEEWLAMS